MTFPMNHRKQTVKYLAFDFFSSILAWILFYFYQLKQLSFIDIFYAPASPELITGSIAFPVFWILFYFFWGFYRDIFRRSRIKELGASFTVTLTGTLIIYIYMVFTDVITGTSTSFFSSFIVLFYIQFTVSYLPRLFITSYTISSIRKGTIGFNTIIIGSDKKAVDVYREIKNQPRSTGNKFIGFVNINGNSFYPLEKFLTHLGGLDQLAEIISKYSVEEVIIAIETSENGKIERIISRIDHPKLVVKAIPGMHDILTGRVRINTIMATPLLQISHSLMTPLQQNIKQIIDILFSVIALILLLPVSIIIMIWIKLSSPGPVIYSHERIGKNGKPFRIYKFRTMIDNAEQNGPELSSPNDSRVTKLGRFLRKTRLDEIPNFINVLKGEMSLVGPRPERRYYIDKIVSYAPHYNHLLKIKPGITSWGQVKYGYAENVGQMIQRLRYDILYLENMSVFVDFQILILTFLIILKRKGV
jgi:exopolysaccharide biosynthesis polyprenyl glycosylphosphotransferase